MPLGAAAEPADAKGWTALALAAAGGHADAVKALLASHGDAAAPTAKGETPLYLAVWKGFVETVQALLAARADANAASFWDVQNTRTAAGYGGLEGNGFLVDAQGRPQWGRMVDQGWAVGLGTPARSFFCCFLRCWRSRSLWGRIVTWREVAGVAAALGSVALCSRALVSPAAARRGRSPPPLEPFRFTTAPSQFHWVPFQVFIQPNGISRRPCWRGKTFWHGGIIGLSHDVVVRVATATSVVFVLLAGIEAGQIFFGPTCARH